jgi:hypothetical protein
VVAPELIPQYITNIVEFITTHLINNLTNDAPIWWYRICKALHIASDKTGFIPFIKFNRKSKLRFTTAPDFRTDDVKIIQSDSSPYKRICLSIPWGNNIIIIWPMITIVAQQIDPATLQSYWEAKAGKQTVEALINCKQFYDDPKEIIKYYKHLSTLESANNTVRDITFQSWVDKVLTRVEDNWNVGGWVCPLNKNNCNNDIIFDCTGNYQAFNPTITIAPEQLIADKALIETYPRYPIDILTPGWYDAATRWLTCALYLTGGNVHNLANKYLKQRYVFDRVIKPTDDFFKWLNKQQRQNPYTAQNPLTLYLLTSFATCSSDLHLVDYCTPGTIRSAIHFWECPYSNRFNNNNMYFLRSNTSALFIIRSTSLEGIISFGNYCLLDRKCAIKIIRNSYKYVVYSCGGPVPFIKQILVIECEYIPRSKAKNLPNAKKFWENVTSINTLRESVGDLELIDRTSLPMPVFTEMNIPATKIQTPMGPQAIPTVVHKQILSSLIVAPAASIAVSNTLSASKGKWILIAIVLLLIIVIGYYLIRVMYMKLPFWPAL